MKRLLAQLVFIVCFFYTPEVLAWGTIGHRVVAEIGQRHLSKKAKKELRGLIGSESLAYWSNWPDFIKSDTTDTWRHASPWHYVNIEGELSKADFTSKLSQAQGPSLYTQIPAMMEQIRNKSLAPEQRRVALYWLIHLVGDLHQPLHVGRAEDLGGNRIKVTWFGDTVNIHNLWDEKLVEFQDYSYTEFASEINLATREQVQAWQATGLMDWTYETYQMANKVYARTPAGSKLSYGYNYIFKNDLETQLLKGGVRLAGILNELFK